MRSLIHLFVNIFLRIFLFFRRRNKHIIVCTGWGGKRFADNSRYMFLFLNENKDMLGIKKVVWLTNNEEIEKELSSCGYLACKRFSLKSIYYHLRAGIFFYDQFSSDLLVPFTKGAKLINLWHGLPIKKFGLADSHKKSSSELWDLGMTYLLSCSGYGDYLFNQCFRVKKENLIHGMYPRNYYLNEVIPFITKSELYFLNIIKQKKKEGKKIIFYLPTFRSESSDFLGVRSMDQIEKFFDILECNNFFFVSKLHLVASEKRYEKLPFVKGKMLELPYEIDVYLFLKYTDILITDYSSVFFDFLYLDRDIICYAYDFEKYSDQDRGFIVNYDSLPAIKAYTLSELENCILNVHKYDLSGQRMEWLHKCFGLYRMEDTVLSSLNIY
mgnify:CR=1 FL=1